MVPREWIAPPDHDTADGELLEEDGDNERASMLRQGHRRSSSFRCSFSEGEDGRWTSDEDEGGTKGKGPIRDTDGRNLPAIEHAPHPH